MDGECGQYLVEKIAMLRGDGHARLKTGMFGEAADQGRELDRLGSSAEDE
jgi:hypothetical protein